MKKLNVILFALLFLGIGAAQAQFTDLVSFTGTSGSYPGAYSDMNNLTPSVTGDTLFGMTSEGGTNNEGNIFSVHTDGTNYIDLIDFTDTTGSYPGEYPYGSLTLSGGVLYGMTYEGGTNNEGSIFSVHTDGTNYTDLIDFTGTSGSYPGAYPEGSLTLSVTGDILFGMTYRGGANDSGCIFSVHKDGSNYTDMIDFTGVSGSYPGAFPYGSLTLSGGVLYGMTYEGGTSNYGNIFSVHTDGTGYTDRIDFTGETGSYPGEHPYGSLTLPQAGGGVLYGMTYEGGTNGYGNVFSVDTDGTNFRDMVDFTGYGGSYTGYGPYGSLTLSGGVLYGMTAYGGEDYYGNIFSVNTDGSGYTNLVDFTGETGSAPGSYPYGSLTLPQAGGGALYGMAYEGGTNDEGTIFKYIPPKPALTTIANATGNIGCYGGNSGSATASADGGTPPYIYSWAPSGGTNTTISNLTAGTYTVTVRDSAGSSATASVTITQPAEIVLSTDSTSTSACGNFDGTASVSVTSGGISPFTYSWNDAGSQTTATASGLPTGNYTVTVTDNTGCSVTANANVLNGGGAVNITGTSVTAIITCNGDNDGSVSATIGGGTTPYTYSWSNGSTGNTGGNSVSISGLSAGTYSITVQDNGGCTSTTQIILTQPSLLESSITGTNIYCGGDSSGSVVATVSGGTLPYTYSWSSPKISNAGTVAGGSLTFSYTGAVQNWTVPAGIKSITLAVAGAQGGSFYGTGGNGVSFTGVCTVTPGDVISIVVGGQGQANDYYGGEYGGEYGGSGGGGGTFVYDSTQVGGEGQGGTPSTSGLLAVAGGGGGEDSYEIYEYAGNGSGAPGGIDLVNNTATNDDADDNGAGGIGGNGGAAGGSSDYAPGGAGWISNGANADGDGGNDWANGFSGGAEYSSTYGSSGGYGGGGGSYYAGGGGGGYNGGGGGNTYTVPGGGGGGSYFNTAYGSLPTATATHTGNGSVTISYPAVEEVPAGAYSVSVTDANGCTATASVTITQAPALRDSIVTASTVNENCHGDSSGRAVVGVSGGGAPYTYSWSSGGGSNATISSYIPSGTQTFSYTGSVQKWTVPAGITSITVSAAGAQGGEFYGAGGKGASFTGVCTVTPGHVISIAVGGQGQTNEYAYEDGGDDGGSGGGGGTFVYDSTITGAEGQRGTPSTAGLLAVAGGGGGEDSYAIYAYSYNGSGAPGGTDLVGNTATNDVESDNGAGGTGGSGGNAGLYAGDDGSGGTGWISNGGSDADEDSYGGSDWANGFSGGTAEYGANGGYGGGGGSYYSGGGGGGYNGGGGGNYYEYPGGGGGGSYLNGSVIGTAIANQSGNGVVTISYIRGTSAGLIAGTYSVTVTDANGCRDTASVTITQPYSIDDSIVSIVNVSCSGTGSATVGVKYGTSPYTYSWSGGAGNNATATGLGVDSYTVTVQDAHGCSATTSVAMVEGGEMNPIVSVNQNTTQCSSTGSATVNLNNGGNVNFSYTGGVQNWTVPAGVTTITVNVAGARGGSYYGTGGAGASFTGVCTVTPGHVISFAVGDTGQPSYYYGCSGGGGTYVYDSTITGAHHGTPSTAALLAIAGGGGGENSYEIYESSGDGSGGAGGTDLVNNTPTNDDEDANATGGTGGNGGSGGTDYEYGAGGGAGWLSNGGSTEYAYGGGDWANRFSGGYGDEEFGGYGGGGGIYYYGGGGGGYNGGGGGDAGGGGGGSYLNGTLVGTAIATNTGTGFVSIIVPSGGVSPYTYLWSDGASQTTATVTGLAAGSYTVTLHDATGCSATASVSITAPAAVIASASVTQNATECNNTGSATASLAINANTTQTFSYKPAIQNWTVPAGITQITLTTAGAQGGGYYGTGGMGASFSGVCAVTPGDVISIAVGGQGQTNPYGGEYAGGGGGGGTFVYDSTITGGEGQGSTPTGGLLAIAGGGGGEDSYEIITYNGDGSGAPGGIDLLNNTPTNDDADDNGTGGTGGNGGSRGTGTDYGAGGGAGWISNGDSNSVYSKGGKDWASGFSGGAGYSSDYGSNGGYGGGGGTYYSGGGGGGYNGGGGGNTYTVPGGGGGGSYFNTAYGSLPTATATNTGNGFVSIQYVGPGGTPPYTYSWSPSGGSNTIASGLSAGTYTLTVTDNSGCSTTASVIINQPGALHDSIVTASTVNVSCNGLSNGSATVGVRSGTLPYTYSWSNGSNDSIATGLSAGAYMVTVMDSCGASLTASVSISQPTALSASASVTASTCTGQSFGSASASPSGGTSPYTYSWSGGGGNSTTASGLSAGAYIVTVQDSCGASATASVSISQPSELSVSASATANVTCNGQSNGIATAVASGGSTPYDYTWNEGSAGYGSTVSGLSAGTYTMTVYDNCSLTATASVSISQPNALSASASVTANVTTNGGDDGSATASPSDGTSPYTYSWSGGAGNSSTASGLSADSYTVTVNDSCGASATASVTITQPTAFSISASVTANIQCNGGNSGSASASPIGGTSPYTYSWSGGGGNNSTASGLSAGSYTVTVQDNSEASATASVTITQPQALSIQDSIIANSGCGKSLGNAMVNLTGGTSPYTYTWSNGTSTVSNSNPTGAILGPGGYTVTVQDICGNSATASVSVQPLRLEGLIGDPITCNGASNGLVKVAGVSGGRVPYTYSWNTGSDIYIASNLSAGTYSVTVTDNNGCSSTASVTLTEPALLRDSVASITYPLCNGQTGGATIGVKGGTTPYRYLWAPNTSDNTAIVTGLTVKTYSVQVADARGCRNNLNFTITQPVGLRDSIIRSATANASCLGNNGSATVGVKYGTPPYTYSWSGGGGNNSTAGGLSAGTYTVTVNDAGSCVASVTASVTIGQNSTISATAFVGNPITCNGASNGLVKVAGVTGGEAPYTYSWSNGSAIYIASNLSTGTYSVTVTDRTGCSVTESVILSQPATLRDSVASLSPPPCTGGTGRATIGVMGGTSPYRYAWAPNISTTDSVEGLTVRSYTVLVRDNNGCSSYVYFSVSCSDAVEAPQSNSSSCCPGMDNINLYPNPNTGQFTLSGLQKDMILEVYDYTGKKISSISASGETMQLNIFNEANGVYLVRILDKNGNLISQKKVVKTQ